MSELPPPYLPTAYPPECDGAGYMPLLAVFAALDFVLSCAKDDNTLPSTAAARDFLTQWVLLGETPSPNELASAQQAMRADSVKLVDALQRAFEGFIVDLHSHPSCRPGTAFGAFHLPLQLLKLQP